MIRGEPVYDHEFEEGARGCRSIGWNSMNKLGEGLLHSEPPPFILAM